MADRWDNNDEQMSDVSLSETSNDSVVNDAEETRSLSNQTSEPAQTASSPVEESNPTSEAILETETSAASQTSLTDFADSAPDPLGQRSTSIHPISEGGNVAWKNHDDLVFRQGKDRGARVPTPALPVGYQSQGPLPKFDFTRLRDNDPEKEAVTDFLENYIGKQEQVPIELVIKMKAFYDDNENSRLSYLAGRSLTIQELNDTIKLQDQEIAKLSEGAAEAEAIKIFDAKRGEKIKELNWDVKQKENTIKNLENTIAKRDQQLQDLSGSRQQEEIRKLREDDKEKDEVINELLLKINEFRINADDQKENSPESEGLTQILSNKTVDEMLIELRRRREAYNEYLPSKGALIKRADEIKDTLTESTVRCLLIHGNRYLESYEASAALEIFERAEKIVAQDLPGHNILHGKVLCQRGRALYELRHWREAETAFEKAIKLGFVTGCGELDGSSAERFLRKARKALRRSTDLTWVPKHKKPQ